MFLQQLIDLIREKPTTGNFTNIQFRGIIDITKACREQHFFSFVGSTWQKFSYISWKLIE